MSVQMPSQKLGKVRIECKDGHPHSVKVTVDGILVPCTSLRISPITSEGRNWLEAEIGVMVNYLDLKDVEGRVIFESFDKKVMGQDV